MRANYLCSQPQRLLFILTLLYQDLRFRRVIAAFPARSPPLSSLFANHNPQKHFSVTGERNGAIMDHGLLSGHLVEQQKVRKHSAYGPELKNTPRTAETVEAAIMSKTPFDT